MTTADTDIDLDLNDSQPVRYIRPAQPYVIASRVALSIGTLVLAASFYAALSGRLTLESKALPLILAAVFLCGIVSTVFSHRADRIDTPAILIDDQEV